MLSPECQLMRYLRRLPILVRRKEGLHNKHGQKPKGGQKYQSFKAHIALPKNISLIQLAWCSCGFEGIESDVTDIMSGKKSFG